MNPTFGDVIAGFTVIIAFLIAVAIVDKFWK